MTIERVIITGLYHGQRIQNVLHFKNQDGTLTPFQVADEVKTNFVTQLKALQNFHYQYQYISVQAVDTSTPAPPFQQSILGFTGDFSGQGYHNAIAAIFSIRTAISARRGRGRFYMGGVHGASVVDSIMEAGASGAYATKAAILTARFKLGGTGPLVLGVFPRNSTSSADFVSMVQLIHREIFGVQRRRNIGVGI